MGIQNKNFNFTIHLPKMKKAMMSLAVSVLLGYTRAADLVSLDTVSNSEPLTEFGHSESGKGDEEGKEGGKANHHGKKGKGEKGKGGKSSDGTASDASADTTPVTNDTPATDSSPAPSDNMTADNANAN